MTYSVLTKSIHKLYVREHVHVGWITSGPCHTSPHKMTAIQKPIVQSVDKQFWELKKK